MQPHGDLDIACSPFGQDDGRGGLRLVEGANGALGDFAPLAAGAGVGERLDGGPQSVAHGRGAAHQIPLRHERPRQIVRRGLLDAQRLRDVRNADAIG